MNQAQKAPVREGDGKISSSGKNIVIFSDGTGNVGGVLFDEDRSNIYKLYRACRVCPDSEVNPTHQVAYYDAGLGSKSATGGTLRTLARRIYNIVSQATGLGITKNIIDCYAAIIRHWEKGDRILLFGFSRGAYTVRCLAGVLAKCGVPTHLEGGQPIKLDHATTRRLAEIAVKKVYQHTTSWKVDESLSDRRRALLDQREQLAAHFRETFGSNNKEGVSNAFPHFIGVFDTVASLANRLAIMGLFAVAIASIAATAYLMHITATYFGFHAPFIWLFVGILAVVTGVIFAALVESHLKIAITKMSGSWWSVKNHFFLKKFSIAQMSMKFYDQDLSIHVGFARHAISVDERRSTFDRLKWGNKGQWRKVEDGAPTWLKQYWFPGNHSDIGGSYPENESRLSDNALKWMVEEATNRFIGLKVDPRVLQLWPSPAGMQHDEAAQGLFKFASKMDRDPVRDATLHESVIKRFELPEVLHFELKRPYRPGCLAEHKQVAHFYEADVLLDQFGDEALLEAEKQILKAKDAEEVAHMEKVKAEIVRRKALTH